MTAEVVPSIKESTEVKQNLLDQFDKESTIQAQSSTIAILKAKILELELKLDQSQHKQQSIANHEDEMAMTIKQNQTSYLNEKEEWLNKEHDLNQKLAEKNEIEQSYITQLKLKDDQIKKLERDIEKLAENKDLETEQHKLLADLKQENDTLKQQLSELPTNNKIQEIFKQNEILKNQVNLQKKIIDTMQRTMENMPINYKVCEFI